MSFTQFFRLSLGPTTLIWATTVFAEAMRVGSAELEKHATFAVASDSKRGDLHFVYGDDGQLYHIETANEGKMWSKPNSIGHGTGQELAADGKGILHLVHATNDARRIMYLRRTAAGWSQPQDLTSGIEGGSILVAAPRIAIDGADNLHVIYWTHWQGKEWKQGSRCVYLRWPVGADGFEPPVLWRDRDERGFARYGQIAIDPQGDAHFFYAAGYSNRHHLERRIRRQDGSWGRHDLWPGNLLSDWCIGAAVSGDGVAHVAVQSRIDGVLKVVYQNNSANTSTLIERHNFGAETFETFTDVLARPNGDLWVATGHVEEMGEFPGEPAGEMPNIGMISHFDSATSSWSARRPLSPEGAINLDSRRANAPRLVLHNGIVRVFYAEKRPGEKWRHWQRSIAK